MIRQYRQEDESELVRILQEGIIIFVDDQITSFLDENETILVEEGKWGIRGFASYRKWGENEENGKIMIYVEPKARKKGIGTSLYTEIMKHANGAKKISTDFRSDIGDSASFYKKHGFQKWYGIQEMRYAGLRQEETNIVFEQYQDCYFEQYCVGMQNSFYEMRKANDFRPYMCCPMTNEKRKELADHQKDIYLMIEHGELIGSASVKQQDKDTLGPIFVVPEKQGMGYGKLIAQTAINKAIERGIDDINLEVVEWNVRAIKLYESLGFETVQIINSYIKQLG